ncbi:MAG: phage major capsid protein [Oligoflexales bacterium]
MNNQYRKMGGQISFDGSWVPSTVDHENHRVEIVASTGSRGIRVPWFDEPYFEELSMQEGAIRLDRFNNGAPLLDTHENSSLSDQIGVVERAWLADGKLYASVKFRSNEKSQEIFQDVANGTIRNVSVGYRIHEMEERKDEGDDYVTRTAKDWEPMELSFVPIGFDPEAKTRNSQDSNPILISRNISENTNENKQNTNNKELVMTQENNNNTRNEVLEILEVGEKFGKQALAKEFISNGRTVEEFKNEVLSSLGSSKVAQPARQDIGLNESEQKRYSIIKALRASVSGDWNNAGFELEVSRTAQKQYKRSTSGFLIPSDILKRDMMVSPQDGVTTGGSFVAQELSTNYIEMLFNSLVSKKLGAEVLSLSGPVAFPKETSDLDAYWVQENGTPPSSQITTEQVALSPKTVGANVNITRDLLMQSSIGIEQYIMKRLSNKLARKIDEAVFFGSGTNNEPKGIVNWQGVHKVNSGGTVTMDTIIAMETQIADANAAFGSLAYLTNAKVMGLLKQKLQRDGIPGYIWTTVAQGEGIVNGYPAHYSNMIPSNLGDEKSLSAMIFGNYNSIILGEFGYLDIEANPWSHHASGAINVRALQSCDIAITHPEAFSVVSDVKTKG